ncbi:MAG: ammonium transporter [Methylotenera sp.]|nr:ammonium transporter [Methylotenera sp.]
MNRGKNTLYRWILVAGIMFSATLPALAETSLTTTTGAVSVPVNPSTIAADPNAPAPAGGPSASPTDMSATPADTTMSPTPTVVAPVPAPPTAPTATFEVGFDKISSGDTAWMLTSTALVLLMTIPGLVLFYAGMVRKKNVLSTALQSFAICCVVTVLWVLIGYSLAFTPGSTPFLGSFDRVLLNGLSYIKATSQLSVNHIAPTIPESVFIMFQMTFAIITPALIVGAFAERMRFTAMLIFMSLWSVLVYAPVAHWVWEPSGLLASKGVLDFAGGTVVHINAGAAGLVCAYMLGPRTGFGKVPFIPYNLVYTLVGASLLWVGWFGFNAGSAVAADGRAGMAMLVTQIAAAVAALTWIGIEYFIKSRITMLGFASGAVAGLVAITPASGFVNVNGALAIGLAAGIFCYWGATALKRLLGADDALDVFGIHGIGGLVGAILTGVFADKAISGLDANLMLQTVAAFGTLIYSAVMTLIILTVVNMFVGLRIDAEEEHDGLDLTQHAERVM